MLANGRAVLPLRRLAAAPPPVATRYISTSRVARDADTTSDNNPDEANVPESTMLRAESITELPPSAGESSPKESKGKVLGYKGWLCKRAGKYKEMVPKATNYVSGNPAVPFPLNPWFRVRTPVSDELKEKMYKAYLERPDRVTPRTLSEKHGLAIKRVEAILKLKAIEHHMVEHEGFVVQKKLTQGMEDMLGVDGSVSKVGEKMFADAPRVSSPRFHAVPEGESFTSADAARVMGRQPYQNIVDRLTASKPHIIDYEGLDPKYAPRVTKKISHAAARRLEELGTAEDQVLEKDPSVTSSRWKYIFVDTAKQQHMGDRAVYIREQDGTLKKAGRDLKVKYYGKVWKR
ncbi:hypothetical protein GGI11_005509 [Coemansia sp. RSA 2049]|nr:hypothetical protein GGI11_005509 [Coemansia sp. RSA 2049]